MSAGLAMGNVIGIAVLQVTVDLPSVAANTTGVASVSVPGVRPGDFVFVNKPSHEAGLGVVNARVSANDTVEITAMNTTAGAVDEVSETYVLLVVRPETLTTGLVM